MNTERLEHLAAELDKRMYRKLKYGNDKYRPEPERKHPIATIEGDQKKIDLFRRMMEDERGRRSEKAREV